MGAEEVAMVTRVMPSSHDMIYIIYALYLNNWASCYIQKLNG